MEITKYHFIAIGIGLTIVGISLFFREYDFFLLLIGIGVLIGAIPFMLSTVYETKVETEKEEMFLEFARNLVESVKVGTPISKSIINMKEKGHGILSPHIEKLANQISLGVPIHSALQIFSKDINNKTISRAITIIGEAERAGGDIGEILESVAGAVKTSDKLKKERRATISTLVAQGYIIFFIFVAIILIMQFKILPMLSGVNVEGVGASLSGVGLTGTPSTSAGSLTGGETNISKELSISFLYLLLIQGLFSGLMIGKLSEGNVKAGIKHSFALMTVSFIISAVANIFA
jgi:flagellar protein FlaJ